MSLPQHPTATQMAKEKHLKAAFEATGLLLQAILLQDHQFGDESADQCDAQDTYILLKKIMERNKLLTPASKPASTRT